ncbi:MAG: glutathione S-transferase N-terminal domain-containing protein [Actinomycetota bacterium]|nr:glutathione S-transferase N-terminal domain-containing protein [Actinomycetota bacterium]
MEARLYVVHGSHPCATVARALELKGIPYRIVEFPPPFQGPFQRVLFGARTVPGLKLDGEKVQGSRTILRRLDELRPDPPLHPADPEARAQVEEAERWGDEVLQPLARRLLLAALRRRPAAMVSYSEHSKLGLPPVAVRASAPFISWAAAKINAVSDDATQADLGALPGALDKVDAWIADGMLGGEAPNAADLQIGSSIRLMLTVADLRPLIEGRPVGELAVRVFPPFDGDMPAGTYPADWLPAAA